MRADFKVTLDACVLAPANLCDLYLRLAETPRLYLPQWSAKILDETCQTQVEDLGFSPQLSASWRRMVETHFPEARVEGYEHLEAICTNDPNDRHVLAAAIQGKADMIVTFNLSDFPAASLAASGLALSHPGDYLITLYSIDPAIVVARLDDIAVARKRTRTEVLANLAKSVPNFSAHVAEALNLDLPD